MKKYIRSIDLFAGIGGMRYALDIACKKHNKVNKTVFSSEIDKYAIKTYEANFTPITHGDITEIKTKEVSTVVPEHDILMAGFPCQPFSNAGLKHGFDDTRGTLFHDIKKILKIKKPRSFLLENVSHLRGHNNGETLKTILRHLRGLGYYVPKPQILNAKNFGLPQNRSRIFIVGFLDNFLGDFEYPEPTKKETSVGQILQSEKEIQMLERYIISKKLWEGHVLRKEKNKKLGKGFGYGGFTADHTHTNTLSARYYKDGGEILILRGRSLPRKLTPRECARLQGFRDSFKINQVSDVQLYRQFGNSIPVNVVTAVLDKMIKFMRF